MNFDVLRDDQLRDYLDRDTEERDAAERIEQDRRDRITEWLMTQPLTDDVFISTHLIRGLASPIPIDPEIHIMANCLIEEGLDDFIYAFVEYPHN